MTITPATAEGGLPVTTLEGDLRDQAALAGVLNTLYELHLPVISVKRPENMISKGWLANPTQDIELWIWKDRVELIKS